MFPCIGEIRLQLNKIVPNHAVSGNPKQASRTNKRRLFSISTNEKQATQAMRNVVESLTISANQNCTNYIVPSHAVSGNVPAAAATPERTTLAWFRCEVLER